MDTELKELFEALGLAICVRCDQTKTNTYKNTFYYYLNSSMKRVSYDICFSCADIFKTSNIERDYKFLKIKILSSKGLEWTEI